MIQKPTVVFIVLLALAIALTGCMQGSGEKAVGAVPEIPEKLELNEDNVPVLKVYNTANEQIEEEDIESYIMGVVAGEMKNDWPMEALKAQAILARTFTLKFVSDKESGYKGADISTDVKEAQAYRPEDINDRVREAVRETRGVVMSADGELPYAWFHAHAGGMTELPSKALEYKADPAYLSVVDSPDSEKAPKDVKNWTVEFTPEEVMHACKDAGTEIGSIDRFEVGEKAESGRAINFRVNDKKVSAPGFRIQIGAEKLKSTMIDSVSMENGKVKFTGHGFGHGVGMSQWGAYGMAEAGKDAKEIISHYFTGVELVELW